MVMPLLMWKPELRAGIAYGFLDGLGRWEVRSIGVGVGLGRADLGGPGLDARESTALLAASVWS